MASEVARTRGTDEWRLFCFSDATHTRLHSGHEKMSSHTDFNNLGANARNGTSTALGVIVAASFAAYEARRSSSGKKQAWLDVTFERISKWEASTLARHDARDDSDEWSEYAVQSGLCNLDAPTAAQSAFKAL